jgi:hypothetical protein
MRQLDLYDNPAISRRTDPVTSHKGAASVATKLGMLHQRCLDALGTDQLTAAELAQRCASAYGGMSESYRKRMKELVDAKEITTRDPRRCSITGKSATIYRKVSL